MSYNRRLYLLRKNTIFYNRQHYLNYLENSCKGNELTFFENILLMGDMLYAINGFIRREKKLTTQQQVSEYLIKLFGSEFRGDRIMHKYIEDLKLVMSYYDEPHLKTTKK